MPNSIEPYDLVPHNAVGILQLNDFADLEAAVHKNKLLAYWTKKHPNVSKTIATLVPSASTSGDLLVFSPKGKETLATTFIGKRPLGDSLPIPYPQVKLYEGIAIHKSKENFFEARMGGLRLRSNVLLTLENCIRNFNQDTPLQTAFVQLKESLNPNSEANLLIRPDATMLTQLLSISGPYLRSKTNSWLAMDIELEEPLEIDGVTLLNDSIANPINWIVSLEQKTSQIPAIVPNSADAFFSLPISNMAQLESNFRRFAQLKNMALSTVDLRELSLVDEIGWLREQNHQALVLHVTTLENQLPLLAATDNAKTYRNITYQPIKLPETIEKFSQAFGQTQAFKWGALLDNFAVFTQNEDFLKSIISQYKDGRVMKKNTAFQTLEDAFSNRGSFLWVAQTAKIFDEKSFPTNHYPLIGLQGVGEADFTHLHFRWGSKSKKTKQGQVNAVANFSLEAPLAKAPQWLKNHRTKGMDVAIQDTQNQLYLFSSKGNLYWKKDLNEPIIGPIIQVDLYKNKKWQMAFRTPKYLYVLDRNGKEVKPFKIKLPKSDQPLPLAVFDYDNNKDYRFVLAQDKRLLLYNKKGQRVKGFKRTQLLAPLMTPPKHARIKKKDYLILQSTSGVLKILNRIGNDRIKVDTKIAFSDNPVFQYLDTFATTDMEGNLVQVDLRGNVIKSPYELKPGHQIDATTKSLVTLSENILTIKGIPVALPYGNYSPPKIYYLNNVLYITTTDLDSQKVYLYYSNATAVSGFPVYGIGAAELSLDSKKKVQMVVATEDNGLVIYQINP